MKLSYLQWVLDQWSTVPPVESADLTGKTVVVVGANCGIGLEAAKHFARMNPCRLIIACRNESKGNVALAEIVSETGTKSCELWKVDLADFASVTKFSERFRQECDRLDILVMNAGIVPVDYEVTGDGWEQGLQVNHLGTALLSLLLLPHLIETGKKFGCTPRLVVVSSMIHYWADIGEEIKTSPAPITLLNSLKYRDTLAMRNRYSETKLMNVFFARALQDRLKSIFPLTVNNVCPGFCLSNARRGYRGRPEYVVIAAMEVLWARTAEEGSRQLVYSAIGELGHEDRMKGAYISRAAIVEPSDFVISEEGKKMQDNVWNETIELLTKEAPQLTSISQEYFV